MGVVETTRRPGESDEQWEERQKDHWAKVAENEKRLLDQREAHRRRMGYADSDRQG